MRGRRSCEFLKRSCNSMAVIRSKLHAHEDRYEAPEPCPHRLRAGLRASGWWSVFASAHTRRCCSPKKRHRIHHQVRQEIPSLGLSIPPVQLHSSEATGRHRQRLHTLLRVWWLIRQIYSRSPQTDPPAPSQGFLTPQILKQARALCWT